MHEKELFDETLDINSTNNYEISIQVSLDGFSFSILDGIRKKFVMFRDYKLSGKELSLAKEMKDIVGKDEFLTKEYRKSRIILNFEKSTIIPASLYDPAIKDDYYQLNHELTEDHIVSNNKLTKPDAYLIFDVRKDVFDTAYQLFPDASVTHQIKPLLYSSFSSAADVRQRYVRAHFNNGFFSIIIIQEDDLKFINTFRVRNDSDILYYLMNSFNKLDITYDQPVWLSGNVLKFDDLYNNLLRYIKTIYFAKPTGEFSLSYVFDDMNTHQYCNLFNIVNCA